MKKLTIIPLILLLSGCPGGGKPLPEHRSVFMQGDNICFSVNKSDVLNYYTISYEPERKYTIIEAKERVNSSYPGTCIKIKLTNGYRYNITYGLNGKYYSDYFFIDKDGNR